MSYWRMTGTYSALTLVGFLTFDSEVVGVDFDGAGFAAALVVHAE